MIVNKRNCPRCGIQIRDVKIKKLQTFNYLQTVLTEDENVTSKSEGSRNRNVS